MAGRFYVGIDGGGTRTRACIIDEQRRARGWGEAGAWWCGGLHDGAVAQGIAAVEAAVRRARRESGLPLDQPQVGAFLSLAGIQTARDAARLRRRAAFRALEPWLAERIGVDGDPVGALATVTAEGPGIVLIAGTGAACWGRDAAGRTWRANGWGPHFSDEGSGSYLGWAALQATMRAYDGRGPDTALAASVLRHVAVQDASELPRAVYEGEFSRTQIAALAPLLIDAAQEGDPVARDILERAIAELTASVAAVVEKLCLYPDTYPLVLAGGLFEHGLFHRLLTEQVGHELPHLKPVKPEHPPAYGAALLALAAGGRAGKETQR